MLNAARIQQHLSIRATARLVGIPPATMQGWLNGKHGPTPALRPQFCALIQALDLDDAIHVEWLDVDQTLGNLRGDDAPYVGLRPYRRTEEPLFFGRDAESRRLAHAVADLQASGPGVLALIGPSGSGKSSLLAAGLVGRHCAPGGVLDGSTGVVLQARDLITRPQPAADIVVVDQCEDLLDLGRDQDAAIAHLSVLAQHAVVVLGVRSNAFARLAELPPLRAALEHPLLIQPMTTEEIRAVITEPARLAGVAVEPALADLIIADQALGADPVATQSLLPLVSHALLLTWGSGSGRSMTVEDYQRTGGVASAVEHVADEIYLALEPDERAVTRRLFLRLISLVDDQPLRRPVPLRSLPADEREAGRPFVDARILTATDTTAQISHDAVLRHWPRLARWIDESRQQLRMREHLSSAAALWVDNGRDAASLIPVDRLPVFTFLDAENESMLTRTEREFLEESRAHFTSVLDRERHTSTRLLRRGRLATALAVLSAVLALVSGVAFVHSREVQLEAQSRQVASLASTLQDRDPNLHAQLSLVSDALADTREGVSSLMATSALDVPTRWNGAASAFVATGSSGAVARVDGTGTVALWREGVLTNTPDVTFTADPAGGQLFTAALARVQGRLLLVTGGAGGYRALWDVTDEPRLIAPLGSRGTLFAAAFAPSGDGIMLAHSNGETSVLERWTLTETDASGDPSPQLTDAHEFPGQVSALALSGDGSRVWVGGTRDVLLAWDVTVDRLAPAPDVPLGAAPGMRALSLAISEDGRALAAGLTSGEVVRWSIEGRSLASQGITSASNFWINGVAFSPDGSRLLTGDSEQMVQVWDVATMTVERRMRAPALVQSVAFVQGNPVSTGVDGSLSAWPSEGPVLRGDDGPIYYLATDTHGTRRLAATVQSEGLVEVWNLEGRTPTRSQALMPEGTDAAVSTALSGSGDTLAAGTRTGQVVVWDVSGDEPGTPRLSRLAGEGNFVSIALNGEGTLLAAPVYTGSQTILAEVGADGTAAPVASLPGLTPQAASFATDGRHLQVGLAEGVVQLWNIEDPRQPTLVASLPTASNPGTSAFSATGSLLAAGTDGGEVYVWDWSTPSQPRLVRQFAGPRASIYTVAFSPDGTTLMAAGASDIMWGWDLTTDSTQATLATSANLGAIYDVEFLAGGSRLAAASTSGQVRVWDLDASAVRDDLCARRGEPLSVDEWERYMPGIQPFDPCA